MSDSAEPKPEHPKKGQRWYDPHRVVLTLFGTIGFCIVCFSGFIFSLASGASATATSSQQKNVQQDARIDTLERDRAETREDLREIKAKVDRILEHVRK